MNGDLIVVVASFAALAITLIFPAGRQALVRHLLVMRRLFIEWPLRHITGRWRADPIRIRTVELGFGIREPTPLEASVERFSAMVRSTGISCSAIQFDRPVTPSGVNPWTPVT